MRLASYTTQDTNTSFLHTDLSCTLLRHIVGCEAQHGNTKYNKVVSEFTRPAICIVCTSTQSLTTNKGKQSSFQHLAIRKGKIQPVADPGFCFGGGTFLKVNSIQCNFGFENVVFVQCVFASPASGIKKTHFFPVLFHEARFPRSGRKFVTFTPKGAISEHFATFTRHVFHVAEENL